jgi:hypothetical protein
VKADDRASIAVQEEKELSFTLLQALAREKERLSISAGGISAACHRRFARPTLTASPYCRGIRGIAYRYEERRRFNGTSSRSLATQLSLRNG